MLKFLRLSLPILLTSALVFNQVGLNLFHDRHDAHTRYEPSQLGKPLLVKHGEHCRVCSIDVLFNLFYLSPKKWTVSKQNESFFSDHIDRIPFVVKSYSKERAPPFTV